jgi:hypothetical protein
VVSELADVNDGSGGGVLGGEESLALLKGNQVPKAVDVDGGAVVEDSLLTIAAETAATEVTRVPLVEEDTHVGETTGVTATARVLPVLTNASVTGGDVTALLTVLGQARNLRTSQRKKKNAA